MGVPAIAIDAVVVDGDKSNTCLDQSPGHQGRLPEQVSTVLVAQRAGFLLKVQCLACLIGGHQVECTFSELVHGINVQGIFCHVPLLVELVQQGGTSLDSVQRYPCAWLQSGDSKVKFFIGTVTEVWIVLAVALIDDGIEWVIGSSQPASCFSRSTQLDLVVLQASEGIRNDHVAGQFELRLSGMLQVMLLDDRSHRGPVVGCDVEATSDRYVPAVSGLDVVTGATVIVVGVAHGFHDGILIGDRSQSRQVFTDLEIG